jgi:Ca2+-transporting ATPase
LNVNVTIGTAATPGERASTIPPHAVPVDQLLKALSTDAARGLMQTQVAQARARHGFNELTEAPPVSRWKKFLSQFKELVIIILIVAAAIAGLLGEWTDALAILAIVLLNGMLGFLQEERAERALAALRQLSAPLSKAIRDGRLLLLPARELVPGDRIELEAGDNIPADCRLIEGFAFRVQEAALTGESAPEDKNAQAVLAETVPLADRLNMAYLGTVVVAGKASGVVVATGMRTELGRIAGMLLQYEPEPTPLQRRLAELGRMLAIVCLAIVALVFVLEWLRGGQFIEVFLLSISLAVAAVPEGLPAVVTIALALGLQRMVKRNALIRKLPSVETLGSVTVICSDKTGTLTRNEMTVREVVAGSQRYQVTGAGYLPRGQFLRFDEETDPLPVDAQQEADLPRALSIMAYCNQAQLVPKGNGAETWQVIGDPTEGALLVAAMKGGVDPSQDSHRVVFEIPFDSERKAMSVVVRDPAGRLVMLTKGAPEVILAKCPTELRSGHIEPLREDQRREILRHGEEMAGRALRVLGLAYRELDPSDYGPYEERDFVFSGLVGMIDPPREEVKEAVRKCRDAGIRPVMITGDHPATALAIARELGIAQAAERVITGQELDGWSDARLAEEVEQIPVYARVSAEHKLRVVRAWKSRGHVVAMTGDGVNDAPAVKTADIGIAMGITGTDVTKEASAMVLLDDNFASIVNAVEEGRGIFDNIQKVLCYLLSCNCGEILLILVASLLGWPAPLIAVQLLWINLVTDGLPALALSLEPPEPDVMRRKPRPPKEPILNWPQSWILLLQGTLVGGVALVAFGIYHLAKPEDLNRARTMTFCVLVYAQLLLALAARSRTFTLWQLGLRSNLYLLGAIGLSALLQLIITTLPFARPVFESVGHTAWEWVVLAVLTLIPVSVLELIKILRA